MSLQVNQLIGFGVGGGISGPALTFIGTTTSGNDNQSTRTFTSVNIGTATSDRLVIVATGNYGGAGSDPSIASITIGGSAATIHADAHSGSAGYPNSVIASRLVTSGTTATIVINYNGVSNTGTISVWTLTGYVSSTPTATATTVGTSSTSVAATMTVPAGGVALYSCFHVNAAASSWSSATEADDYDVYSTFRLTDASLATASVLTSHVETCSWTGSVNSTIAAVAWN